MGQLVELHGAPQFALGLLRTLGVTRCRGDPCDEEMVKRFRQGSATVGLDGFAALVPTTQTAERIETHHEGTGMSGVFAGGHEFQHGFVRRQCDQPAGRGHTLVNRSLLLLQTENEILGRFAAPRGVG